MSGKFGKTIAHHTFGDAMQRYSDEISPTRKGCRWEQVRLRKLKRDSIADIMLSQLTTSDLQDWIERQTISPASIHRELTLLQSVLKRCRHPWRWMYDNITHDLVKPPLPKHRNRRISKDEEDKILLQLGYDESSPIKTNQQILGVAFLFALETGMRQGEIWSLEWKHIHLIDSYAFLPDTKNGSSREVPLSNRAKYLLQKLAPSWGKVFKTNQASAGAAFRKAVKKCNIENLTFHDTRHEACTRLSKSYSVIQLAKVIGHQDINNLQIYYNPTGAELAKMLD